MRSFENIVGEEYAGYMYTPEVSLFSHNVFVSVPKRISIFKSFTLSSANALDLDQSKVLLFDKELIDEDSNKSGKCAKTKQTRCCCRRHRTL